MERRCRGGPPPKRAAGTDRHDVRKYEKGSVGTGAVGEEKSFNGVQNC